MGALGHRGSAIAGRADVWGDVTSAADASMGVGGGRGDWFDEAEEHEWWLWREDPRTVLDRERW